MHAFDADEHLRELRRRCGYLSPPLAAAGVPAAAAAAAAGNAAIATLHEAGVVMLGHGIHPDMCYNMPEDVRARVQAADKWMDLSKPIRDKLAAAIRRSCSMCDCPIPVIKRWVESKGNPEDRLQFIKEFAEDTSFARVDVYERHMRCEEYFDETLYHRVSKAGLRRKYNTDCFPNRERWIEEDLRGARGRPLDNPDHPGDPEWALHRVLIGGQNPLCCQRSS